MMYRHAHVFAFLLVVAGGCGQVTSDGAVADAPSYDAAVADAMAADAAAADAVLADAMAPDAMPDAPLCDGSGEVTSVTLAFETDFLDLDTGTIVEGEIGPPTTPWDVKAPYNSNGTVHARIFQNRVNSVEVAFLDKTFTEVTSCDVAAATFTTDLVDEPFAADVTVLVKTDQGAIFKLGNPSESDADNNVTFDTAPFSP